MSNRIVYLSWPANEISGGIKICYRHVESLQASGYEAIVATPDGRQPGWFPSTAPTYDLTAVRPTSDILVFPENHHGLFERFASWSNRKVVLCQNQFMVHRGIGKANCYSDFGVSDVLAVGRHVVDFCERRFRKLRIFCVPVFVDTDVFRVGEHKKLQIAYSPRKRPLEVDVIRDLFRHEHFAYRDVPWVAIANHTEREVASILQESAIYLSLCRFEAFPLSILEAFAAGCIVAGFTGFGGRIYTTSANGFWSDEDDCLGCATQLGKAVRTVTAQQDAYQEMVSAAIAVSRRLTQQRFCDKLVRFWSEFVTRNA